MLAVSEKTISNVVSRQIFIFKYSQICKKTVQLSGHTDLVRETQCYQILEIFATMAKFKSLCSVFKGLFNVCKTYFGKFLLS